MSKGAAEEQYTDMSSASMRPSALPAALVSQLGELTHILCSTSPDSLRENGVEPGKPERYHECGNA